MPRKRLYLYNAYNNEWFIGTGVRSGALLTFPIGSLYRTQGCVYTDSKTKNLLVEENIGKKFNIEFLDPVRAESVKFCGRVSLRLNSCLPKYMYAHMQENKFFYFFNSFFVFKKGREYIVVNTRYIEAKLAH